MVASSGIQHSRGPPPLGNARTNVPVHAMDIKMASKQVVIFHCRCFACDPGGRWGDTE